jgi:hypothetical protein
MGHPPPITLIPFPPLPLRGSARRQMGKTDFRAISFRDKRIPNSRLFVNCGEYVFLPDGWCAPRLPGEVDGPEPAALRCLLSGFADINMVRRALTFPGIPQNKAEPQCKLGSMDSKESLNHLNMNAYSYVSPLSRSGPWQRSTKPSSVRS